MIPTYHVGNNGHLVLLFVIPMLGKKICFCSIKNWKKMMDLTIWLSNFGVENYLQLYKISFLSSLSQSYRIPLHLCLLPPAATRSMLSIKQS